MKYLLLFLFALPLLIKAQDSTRATINYDSLVAKVNAMDSTYKAHIRAIRFGGQQLERGGLMIVFGTLCTIAGSVLATIPPKNAKYGDISDRQAIGIGLAVAGTGLNIGGAVHLFAAGRNLHKMRDF